MKADFSHASSDPVFAN